MNGSVAFVGGVKNMSVKQVKKADEGRGSLPEKPTSGDWRLSPQDVERDVKQTKEKMISMINSTTAMLLKTLRSVREFKDEIDDVKVRTMLYVCEELLDEAVYAFKSAYRELTLEELELPDVSEGVRVDFNLASGLWEVSYKLENFYDGDIYDLLEEVSMHDHLSYNKFFYSGKYFVSAVMIIRLASMMLAEALRRLQELEMEKKLKVSE